MIHLEKIDQDNVWKILKLKVSSDQEDLVASNTESIVEAYLALANGGYAYPFGIYEDDVPVGFVMIGYGVDDGWEDPPKVAYGNYSIWRLMIDENFQHRGYGRKALELALDFVRTFPCGEAEYCYLSYEPENIAAKALYSSVGFTENGETDGDELVAVLKL